MPAANDVPESVLAVAQHFAVSARRRIEDVSNGQVAKGLSVSIQQIVQDSLISAILADRAALAQQAGVGQAPVAWRCFHCDEVFTDERLALEHFGPEQDSVPACKIGMGAERSLVRALRDAEAAATEAVRKMHDESTEGYKAYYAAASRHHSQLQAAEEAGYERGLRDVLPTQPGKAQP